MNLAKKIFAGVSALAMVVAASPAYAAVHAAGTNVNDNGTVRFVDNNGQTRAYTSAGAFLSYGFNSWAGLVPASAEDLALPRGSFVAPMPGSLINDKGTVYLMVDSGNGVVTRSGFTTPGNFLGLGYSWSNVMAGDTSFLTANAPINTTAMAHPSGTLVNQDGTVYLMTPSGKMGIPSLEVFNSWGFSFSKVVAANSYDRAVAMSSGIMPARVAGMLYPSQGNQPNPVGTVNVGLASSNPAASVIATGSTSSTDSVGNTIAQFNFTGNGTVTNVTLKRIGVSADETLANVYLYDGSTRLTDAASVSSGMITFVNGSGLFTVNGSKTITVKADINGGSAGQTVGVQLVSASTGSTAVTGTPVSANIHSIASATLATVTASSVTGGGVTSPSNDAMVWQTTLNASREVRLTHLALREIGSISYNDIRNFRLQVDGTTVSTVANLDANGYVTFTPNTTLSAGAHTVRVLADIIGGSSRTYSFSLRTAADLGLVDTQYNAGVVTDLSLPATTSSTTIAAGTLTLEKASNAVSGNVTKDASNVSLGTWKLTARGEPVKVESLTVATAYTDAAGSNNAAVSMRNGRVLVNGVQVGSTTNFTSGSTVTLSTNFVVDPSTPATVEVRADIYDNDGTGSGFETADAITTTLGVGTAQGQMSLSTVTVSAVAGNQLTVAVGSASISASSTLAAATVVAPQSNQLLAAWNVVGNSTEDVNIDTLTVAFTAADGSDGDASAGFDATDLTDVYVKVDGQMSAVKATVGASSNTYTVSFTVPKNGTKTVELYGNITSGASATDTLTATLAASGRTVSSNTAVTVSAVSGRTLTAGTGSISVVTDGSVAAQNVADQQSVKTAGYRFTAVSDAQTITEVVLTIADASTVNTVNLVVDGSVVASKPGATSVTFTGLNIPVAANSSKNVDVRLDLGTVGTGMGTTGSSVLTTLTSAMARPSSTGVEAAVTETVSNPAGPAIYVFAATPTLTSASLASTTLVGGANTPIARFTVAANGGSISWNEVTFSVNKTSAPVLTNARLFDAESGAEIAGTATLTTVGATNTSGSIEFEATNEQFVTGSKTYELRADIGGTIVDNDYVTVSIAQSGLSAQVAATEATVDATTATFVWSDLAIAGHSTSTADWHNDYLVRNLPLSWTVRE